ncbi:fatty acid desaturase [Adhaeribacter sp. BT258]|uniref:Fatty acid desaturase n=1 Tax=Adhaeribacter terrigena TaxID=2793070 RepID=A0ABS1BYE3_9BACT|nr:fatty acid desaturase [Adhaeribacter terrigena]MBK0402193.1 fatty acid desaturase [Adhaeribacter terrigena]
MSFRKKYTGVFIAALIVAGWFGLLTFSLQFPTVFTRPWPYILLLLQTHLYTGLFITAHDAMHGVAAPGNRKLNNFIGFVCALLFAFNWYPRLLPKHHQHHHFVATEKDPDYHGGNFWLWYFSFLKQYITWPQMLAMAVTFNLLKYFFPLENVVLYWMLPAIFATFQLFYFGTYQPHKGEHENKHKSTTLKRNHVWAFVSCYFFGYHYEHHDKPFLPWWKLYQEKDLLAKQKVVPKQL